MKTISIATPGDMTFGTAVSLPIVAPAIETALAELRIRYEGIFNFTQEFVYDQQITSWADMPFYVDDMIARWYYRRQRPHADLTALIYSGEFPQRWYRNSDFYTISWQNLLNNFTGIACSLWNRMVFI